MNIKRFEDLEIWQEARILCKVVYEITSTGPFSTDFKFRDQIRASSGSATLRDLIEVATKNSCNFFQFQKDQLVKPDHNHIVHLITNIYLKRS
jgi:hypothetical protein